MTLVIILLFGYLYFFDSSCNNCCSWKPNFNGSPLPPGGGGPGTELAATGSVTNSNQDTSDNIPQVSKGYQANSPMEAEFNTGNNGQSPAEVTSSPRG